MKDLQLFKPTYNVEDALVSIRSVLESGWTGTGPHCDAFEKEWSSYTKAPILFF